uniref:Nose resistant to fluoxetine protein 6 n=1 Tax=Cacopsylla melanoneura TaxID=428564 RepID=A0A8D8QJT9_9HEMI
MSCSLVSDSSTSIPSGLLAANVYHLGNFDECVSIILPSHGLQGKYCLASAVFSPTRDAYPAFFDGDRSKDFRKPEPFDFVWDTMKESLDPAKIPRNRFHWALCIPSSCTAEDLRLTLDQVLKSLTPKYQVQFNVSVPNTSCYVRTLDESFPTGFWIFTLISILLISLVGLATLYDLIFLRKTENGSENGSIKPLGKWLIPFSGLSNMEKLGSPNEQSEFSVIHALKAISMCQIIIGHRNMNVLGNVTLNPEFTEEKSSQLVWSYFNNGTLVVDTFFLVGGFLTFYFIFFELDKRKGKINYLVVFLYRFIRVTPVYAFVIFFYIYMLPYMNDGPLWRDIIGRESSRCEKNWWSNLLYFNNYYHENEQCMVQSWYLSCDFHFFILGTFLTYLVWRYQHYAKLILSSVLLVFIVLPFCYVYQHDYWGHYRTYISQMRDPPSHPEFQNLYIKSHFRAIPYIIGMMYAYSYIRLKEIEYKFSNMSLWVISLTAFFMGHAPYLLAGLAYIPGRPYYVLEQALFNPLQRVVWSLCIGWIILGHGTTGFGPLSKVFGHRVFVPFSRLTFCAYLIHVAVQITSIATMRTPTYVSYTGLILGVFGDLMFTFLCAFLLNIMIESPLDRFQKRVVKSLIGGLSPGSSKTKDTKVKEEIIEAAFQQGLNVNEKPSTFQGPNSNGPNPVRDTLDKTVGTKAKVVEGNGEEHCHL